MEAIMCNPRVRFIPHYLKDQVINNKELSNYDAIDRYSLQDIMARGLLGAKTRSDVSVESTDKLLELYTSTGEYVFSESTVLINDEVALEIIITKDDIYNDIDMLVICYKGSTNAIAENSINKKRAILTWLVGYLGKRLDESVVYNTDLFSGYWLK